MKILVCLISQQHVPNLLTVHELEPNRLVLVVTKLMEDAAMNLLKALAVGGLDYLAKYDITELQDADSIDQIKQALEEVYRGYPGADWIVNLTGGTKPMSIGAYEFFKGKAIMIYVSERNQSKALDFSGGTPIPLTHRISLAEFIAGYGFDPMNIRAIQENEERARKWFYLSTFFASRSEDSSLRGFLGCLFLLSDDRKGREKGLVLSSSDNVFMRDRDLREKISTTFALTADGEVISGRLDKYAVQFLTGGWLEVFLWGMLSRLEGKAIWDCRLGMHVGKKERPLENDWDMAFMTDQGLRIVECKSGEQGQDKDGGNTLYKIEAIRKQLGALRVKSYLATTAPNILNPNTGEIKDRIATRASLYDCTIIKGEEISRLARLELSKDPNLLGQIAEVFGLNMEGVS